MTENDDLSDLRAVWYVTHADGTTEDIVLDHGNVVEDSTGTVGQVLFEHKAARPEPQCTCWTHHQPTEVGCPLNGHAASSRVAMKCPDRFTLADYGPVYCVLPADHDGNHCSVSPHDSTAIWWTPTDDRYPKRHYRTERGRTT